jgi:DNA polymerase elongation subunit (family B)
MASSTDSPADSQTRPTGDGAPSDAADSAAGAAPDVDPDVALFGKDPMPRIVDVQPLMDRPSSEPAMVRLYQRTEDFENLVTHDERLYPFFFISDVSLLKGRRSTFRYIRLSGDNYYDNLVVFNTWSDYWDAIRTVERRTDSEESRPDEIYRVGSPAQQYMMQSGRTCFLDMTLDDLHRLQLDIEVYSDESFPNAERAEDEIIIVALKDNRGWDRVLHLRDGIGEKQLLQELVHVLTDKNPDVIEGHNIFAFDVNYILDRCERHGVEFAIGRDGSVPRQYDSSMRFAERTVDYPAVDVAGRHVIDTYFQVMSFDVFKRDMPDYSLKTAAKYFGFAPEDRTYIEGADISRAWNEDRELLLDYALDDVVETERLARHLSGSTFYLTQMLPMTYGSSARRGPASKIESLFVREYLRQRAALPRSEWGSQSMGGYTDIFVTGVLGPIVYADVESLYPSIMLNYDVKPDGDRLDLFPTLLDRLTDLRLQTKQDMKDAEDEEVESELDARQSSYKVLINCFDPETEIMTVDGIKPVADVDVGDRVYSLNPDTGEVEIKPVTDTQSQYYEGPMVEIKNRHVDYLVTPNHRFLTQKFTSGTYTDLAWETAEDMLADRIRRRFPSLRPLPGVGETPQNIFLHEVCQRHDIEHKTGLRGIKELRQQGRWQPNQYDLTDWLQILAWYTTEGTLFKSTPKRYPNGNYRGESYRTTLCQKNAEGRAGIEALLDRTGIAYGSDQNGHSFSSKVLYEVLESECGSDSFSKKLPPWIFRLGVDELRVVFDTLMQGDGNARGDRYTTSSDQLAEDFIRLAMHVGRRAFHMRNDGSHRIQVNKSRGQRPTVKPKHRRQVDYEGMIHCVTVADNHTVLAGRDRKFNWCGQSFYGVLGFGLSAFNDFEEADRVARTGQEILRELIAEIRDRGGLVVEVDTDGVLFVPPDGVRGEQEEIDFTVGLTEAMPEGIRVGFDGRYKKMLSYKKKNYALLTYDDELKFKGSSLISRSNEPFGRRFVREAIRLLLDEDVAGLHELYMEYRDNIIASDWESVESFARTETLKDRIEDYEEDVESGKRPRAATYELAKKRSDETGQPVRKGDRITYYITGDSANVTAFKNCKLASEWDPDDPDENTAYYLKRLDEFARKFEPFFTESDFRLVFSPEDLFGFSAEGIEIQRREQEADVPTDVDEEVPF